MPIIKSAIERVRTSEKAEARNASQLSQMRTAIILRSSIYVLAGA